MDWSQVLFIVVSNIVMLFGLLTTTIALYVYGNNQSNNQISAIREEIRDFHARFSAIREEIRDFHARLCEIEAKRK